MSNITLAHGSGGNKTNELINSVFLKYLGEFFVSKNEDAGEFVANGNYALSTDSFVITPIFFKGGDIGKLAVCGSSNDVAMKGAKPEFISIGFILEEGLEIEVLEKILISIRDELKKQNLKILSADTKVVNKGSADKIYINTTAFGKIIKNGISSQNLKIGDKIILSAPIGSHGASIFSNREEINLESNLKSDCAQLYPMLETLFLDSSLEIHALRDATRGGLSAVLHEWSEASEVMILVNEHTLPISDEVKGVCELLGLDAYMLANEGVCVLSVPAIQAESILKVLKSHELGQEAVIIGEVIEKKENLKNGRVIIENEFGVKRFMESLEGDILPRIC